MSLADDLGDLAARLDGAGWWDRPPMAWTPAQRAVFERATDEEKRRYLDDLMHRTFHVIADGEEIPDGVNPDYILRLPADAVETLATVIGKEQEQPSARTT